MPVQLWQNMQKGERIPFDWLECACCSIPWTALTELNGMFKCLADVLCALAARTH